MFVPLMYHLVDTEVQHAMSVREDEFARQLDWLVTSDITVLSVPEALDLLAQAVPGVDHRPLVPRVVLTFDDGYRNTVTTVKTMLDERGLRGLMAVCGSYLDPATTPADIPHASRDFASAADVRAWLEAGHDIAGHSNTHPRLTELSAVELEAEIDIDLQSIAATIGYKPEVFCYPFGKSNKVVRDVVGQRYRYAFVTDGGSWPAPNQGLAIRRLEVRPAWDLDTFRNEVRAALEAAAGRTF